MTWCLWGVAAAFTVPLMTQRHSANPRNWVAVAKSQIKGRNWKAGREWS